MSSGSIAEQIQLLYDTLHEMRLSNYAAVSALTVLAYDIVLTLGREYEHIWKAKWSLPKFLYFCTRYYGVCHVAASVVITTRLNIPVDACKHYFWWTSLGGAIIFTTVVNIILILRIHALFDRNMKVLIFLLLALATEFATELYISTKISIMGSDGVFSAPFGLPFTGCLTNVQTKFTLVAWIPCLVVAFLFFFMTAFKFFKTVKRLNGGVWSFRERKSFSPLLMAFFRDGTVFFFAIAIILLVCTLITTLVTGPLQGVALPWLIGVYSFSGSRLILQLREAAKSLDGNTAWSGTISHKPVPIERNPQFALASGSFTHSSNYSSTIH